VDEPRCPGVNERGGCGVVTARIRGHVCLCLTCSEAEVGMTIGELRARAAVQRAKGRTRKWSEFAYGQRERGVVNPSASTTQPTGSSRAGRGRRRR
jgi:hypothetical protein